LAARIGAGAREALSIAWQWFRGATGDQVYDAYVRHAQSHGQRLLTRREFYVQHLERKYTRPSRCC